MKKTLFLSALLMLGISVFAQKPEISFETKSHDFGEIREENGPVSTVFEFKNTGLTPLVISGVTASCGCTTPDWTKAPVAPGETGIVKATYSVVGRPGSFRKTITVKSNSAEGTTTLTISGTVKPRPKSVEEEYPVVIGDIRLKSRTVPSFEIYRGESKTEKVQFKNVSANEVKIAFANTPKHIVAEANPAVVKAGETGEIVITYNAKNIDDYGNRADALNVLVGDGAKAADDNKLVVNANLKEDFRNLTAEQKQNAPAAELDPTIVKVELAKDSKTAATVTLKNTGKSPLVIRKMLKDTGILSAKAPKTVAPGASATIKMEISSADMNYDTYSKLTIITNSYKTQTVVLPVNIKIKK